MEEVGETMSRNMRATTGGVVLVLAALAVGCSSPAVESENPSGGTAAAGEVAPAAAAPGPAAEASAASDAAVAEAAAAKAAAVRPAANPIPMSDASIRAGRGVYGKICRACHGLQGEGDGVSAPPGSMPASLVDAEWVHGGTDPEIFMTIKYGLEPFDVMEPWGRRLTDEEIWSTINFLRDLAD